MKCIRCWLQATPTERELKLLTAMLGRIRRLSTEAAAHNLRLMIDAEHTYFQPAIDLIAKQMMREFNTNEPVVYNSYQCYLKDSRYRLNGDIESARRQVPVLFSFLLFLFHGWIATRVSVFLAWNGFRCYEDNHNTTHHQQQCFCFPNWINYFVTYFDPKNMLFDNDVKQFSGGPNRYFGV